MPTPSATIETNSISFRLQQAVVGLLFLVHVLASLASPQGPRWPLLAAGCTAVSATYLFQIRGKGPDGSYLEGAFLSLGVSVVLVLGMVLSRPLDNVAAVGAAAGVVTTNALWILHRVPSTAPPPSPLGVRSLQGLGFGLTVALVYSIWAALIIGVAAIVGSPRTGLLSFSWKVILGYAVGMGAAGLLVGILRPLTRWPLGLLLLGIIAASSIYYAMVPAVLLLLGPTEPTEILPWIGIVLGLITGPAAAMIIYDAQAPSAAT